MLFRSSIKTSATSFGIKDLNHPPYQPFLLSKSYSYTPNYAVVVATLLLLSKVLLVINQLLWVVQDLAHEAVEVFVGYVGDILLAPQMRLVARKVTLVVVVRHFEARE